MTTDTKSIEDRRNEVLTRREEVRAELEGLQEERRALAPEVADGDRAAEKKAVAIAGKIAAARESLLVYDDALEELRRREEAERVAAEEARLEALREEYDALDEKRGGIEEKAQAALDALIPALEELEEVDFEQRHLSSQIGGALNQYRVSTHDVVGLWLESGLHSHLPGVVAAKPGFLEPLTGLNPLERRAPRPAELAEARERNAAELAEREERDRAEREDLDRTRDIGERYEQLMGRFISEDSEVRRRHEEEFVVPTLVREYGVEALRALGLEPERLAEAESEDG